MPTSHLWSPNWSSRVRRREFLAWVSALVVAPSLPRISWASEASPGAAAAAPTELPSLAIAYLEGSDSWDLSRVEWRLAGSYVVPAKSLAGGDGDLALGLARLTVRGLYPDPLPAGIFERLELSVYYPSPEPDRPEDYLRYFAWAYGESPVLNLGAANRFDVPVGVDGTLPLLLDSALCGDGTESCSRFANFTVDNDPLRPKLRRGAYLLALAGDPWAHAGSLPVAGEPVAPELMSLLMTVEEGSIEDDGGGGGSEPWEPPPGDGQCGGADGDLLLVGQDVGSTRTETACRSVTALDYRVREQGAVTFDSPTIALGDGFEVQGEFEAINPES